MANMQMNKTPMKEQDPNVRNANFLEVALGYTLDEAVNEAKRCIHCKNPACVTGCPVCRSMLFCSRAMHPHPRLPGQGGRGGYRRRL